MLGAWERTLQSLGKPGCGNPTHSPLPKMSCRMPETPGPSRGLCEGGNPPCSSPSSARPPEFSGPSATKTLPPPRSACPACLDIILAIVPLPPPPALFSGPQHNGAFAASSTQGGDELTVFPSLKILVPPPSHPPPLTGVSRVHLTPGCTSFLLPWVRCKGHR